MAVFLHCRFLLPQGPSNPPSIKNRQHCKHLSLSKRALMQRCSSSSPDLVVRTLSKEGTNSHEVCTERLQKSMHRSVLDGPATPDYVSNFSSSSISHLVDNEAPLVSALEASAKRRAAGFHFPGHNRGNAAPTIMTKLIGKSPYAHDLPELPELDNLFSPDGVILDSQQRAAELFGATQTWFLVGGTTCGIQASIMGTCSPGETIVLPRNSHLSVISGMVLSGALPKYIIPEYNSLWDIAGGVNSDQVKKAIDELNEKGKEAAAVLITSPTYNGICSDLKGITDLCHARGIPLIVDEAHGAHFKFDPRLPRTALEQGADLVVQSTHKVLCSLSQSSMLHLSGSIADKERIGRCLQTLQSSSPNYLLLASLDAARAQLSQHKDTLFTTPMNLSYLLSKELSKVPGVSVLKSSDFQGIPEIDPLRVTLGTWQLGLSGYKADEFLCAEHDVIAELALGKSITFAISLGNQKEDVERLVHGVKDLSVKFHSRNSSRPQVMNSYGCAPFVEMNIKLAPREAFFADKRRVSIEESLGEICGELICPYPPGIPVLIPGEVITENALSYVLDARHAGAMVSGAGDPNLHTILVCNV